MVGIRVSVIVFGELLLLARLMDILGSSGLAYADQLSIQAAVPLIAAPVITNPASSQRVSDERITITGTCGNAAGVEIYRSGALAGSTHCTYGQFSINVPLHLGTSVLTARVTDGQGTYGQASAPLKIVRIQTAQRRLAAAVKHSPGAATGAAVLGLSIFITASLAWRRKP